MILLWQNILKKQYVALNFLLTTFPNRNFCHEAHGGHILHYSRIRKNVTENTQRTDREQTENKETNYKDPIDRRVEQANIDGNRC